MDKMYMKILPEAIKDSLSWYTGGNFDKLNEKLRKGIKLDEIQKQNLKNIDMAFEGATQTTKPFTVYKGVANDRVYSDKAFISTSLDINEAKNFAGVDGYILEILVSPGSKSLYLEDISRYKEEKEVLLDRDGVLIATNTYVNKKMNIINCTYFSKDSMVLHSPKDIDKSIESLEIIQDETAVFKRLLEMIDEDEYEFLDLNYVLNIYSKKYSVDDFTKKIIKNFIVKYGPTL